MDLISRICLICYDISSNKVRREIVKLLSDYGKRVQESVFLCDLSIERVKSLNKDLRAFYARKKHGLKGASKAGADKVKQAALNQGGKKKLSAPPTGKIDPAQQQIKPKKQKNNSNQNNTLDILMITVEPGVISAALVLGNRPIDANKPFAVI